MNRLRLFLFYAGLAWLSLFRPSVGLDIIKMADKGAKIRALMNRVDNVFGNTQTPEEGP